MKNLLIAVLALLFTFGATAQTKKGMDSNKKLVAYFSCTGTTKNAAQKLAQAIGADLYEIKPTTPYTSSDLNWSNKKSRSSVEMGNLSSRPKITGKIADMKKYDTVFIGFPIWWNLAPTIINTFLESYDFSGKLIIPFATSGGDGISNSEKALHRTYPKMNWRSGKLLNGHIDKNMLEDWIKKIQ